MLLTVDFCTPAQHLGADALLLLEVTLAMELMSEQNQRFDGVRVAVAEDHPAR
jgi:hypothetical protein